MSDTLITRAELLLNQKRYTEAADILVNLLAQDPNNTRVLAMLSEVNLQQDKSKEAEELINNGISLAPDDDFLHYQKARILISMDRYDAAEKSLDNAIAFNALEPEYFALWASIKLARKKYEAGLELAEKALDLDPENLLALNNRSKALLKLNRKEESAKTIEGALNQDPNNVFTHTTFGWNELEKGNTKKALHHFQEALKQDPNFAYAQAGMLEALKSRYWLYKLFLKYTFWMSSMTAKYQWAVIIGFYVGFRLLRSLSNSNPELAPFLEPLLIVLMVMAFSTWVTGPLSNLFLRLNVYGKHLLSREEKISSNLVGVCASLMLIGIVGLLVSSNLVWTALAVFGFAMMIPCSSVFASTKQKYILPIYTALMAIFGMLAIYNTVTIGQLSGMFATVFILGIIAYQWLANYMLIREDNQ